MTFVRNTTVHAIELPRVCTSSGSLEAERVAVCPGDDLSALYAERIGAYAVTRCKLQMLRLSCPGYQLPAALMSDLGLARYAGYAGLAPCAALKSRLLAEQPDHMARGVHLIVVQSADGTLVVGDSHDYAVTPDPFSHEEVDALILEEFRSALGIDPPPTIERWTGTYASAADGPYSSTRRNLTCALPSSPAAPARRADLQLVKKSSRACCKTEQQHDSQESIRSRHFRLGGNHGRFRLRGAGERADRGVRRGRDSDRRSHRPPRHGQVQG